jgi:hypothetical protein
MRKRITLISTLNRGLNFRRGHWIVEQKYSFPQQYGAGVDSSSPVSLDVSELRWLVQSITPIVLPQKSQFKQELRGGGGLGKPAPMSPGVSVLLLMFRHVSVCMASAAVFRPWHPYSCVIATKQNPTRIVRMDVTLSFSALRKHCTSSKSILHHTLSRSRSLVPEAQLRASSILLLLAV